MQQERNNFKAVNNDRKKAVPPPAPAFTTVSPVRAITPKQRTTQPANRNANNNNNNFRPQNNNNNKNNKHQINNGKKHPKKVNGNNNGKQFKNSNNNNNQPKKTTAAAVSQSVVDDYDYPLDYDYYYDQLVPEHERFFQLPKISSEAPQTAVTTERAPPFQIFTHFAVDNNNNKQQQQPANAVAKKPAQPAANPPPAKKAKPSKTTKPASSPLNSVSRPVSGPNYAGPFGYTDKGTFFIDDAFTGFPERIEMIYQGFVWAMTVSYADQGAAAHGGVHRILEDKVKRDKLNLKGDYIVRVTGRASPYNINKLAFHTANGKVFGPWGERFSEESVDFDVSAPPGHGLAHFSGTIDFGVPLRSIGFHWAKI